MILKQILIFGIICLNGVSTSQSETLKEKENLSEQINLKQKSVVETEIKPLELKEKEIKKHNETLMESLENSKNQNHTENIETSQGSPHVINVMELTLNDEDKVMLQNLNGIIEKVPDMKEPEMTREGKSFKDENLKRAAEALTDEEITEIIKSISFPNNDEITEDGEAIKSASETEIEPRMGRALKNHGYYVIAFTPIEEENDNNLHETVPYTRLQILPAERSMNGDASDNPRLISKKAWNKYIRRIMRQIRKGTRKIQRKTKVKTLKEEPTVENFLKRMYKITQEQRLKQQTKKKSSWFLW